jgi:hypothetical protein
MVGVAHLRYSFIMSSQQVSPDDIQLIIAITHIYDATTHPSLAQIATKNLQACLSALKHMGVAWPSASRSYLMIGDAPRLGILSFILNTNK